MAPASKSLAANTLGPALRYKMFGLLKGTPFNASSTPRTVLTFGIRTQDRPVADHIESMNGQRAWNNEASLILSKRKCKMCTVTVSVGGSPESAFPTYRHHPVAILSISFTYTIAALLTAFEPVISESSFSTCIEQVSTGDHMQI